MNKSVKLRIAAKLILCIGVIACVIGCAAYCVLSLPEVMNLPFSWMYIIVVGAAMVFFILLSIILSAAANAAERRAMKADVEEEVVEEIVEETVEEPKYVCDNECCEECAFADQCDFLAAEKAAKAEAAEATEEEAAECEATEEEAPAGVKLPAFAQKWHDELPEEARETVDKVVAVAGVAANKVKENADKIVPAVVAGVAVIAVAKGRKARRQAKARRNFFKWLGC